MRNNKPPYYALILALLLINACNLQNTLHLDGEELKAFVDGGNVTKTSEFINAEEDFEINECYINNRTPLQYAVYTENLKMARLFLEQGADPDVQDMSGTTALMIAAESGKLKMVKLLLKYEADHALKNNYGQTSHRLKSEKRSLRFLKKSKKKAYEKKHLLRESHRNGTRLTRKQKAGAIAMPLPPPMLNTK